MGEKPSGWSIAVFSTEEVFIQERELVKKR